MKLEVFSSAIETSRELILRLVELMEEHPDRMFHLAVSGGEAAALVFDLWAHEYREVTVWNRLRIFWVDERCVSPEDAASHYGMMCNLLLGVVPIPYENVFRIRGEAHPQEEALRYSETVSREVPSLNGWPAFDAVLLGAGDDGHTASLFAGQEERLTSYQGYVSCVHPRNGQKWIGMTGGWLLNAHRVIFLLTGKSKAMVVREICCSGDTGSAAYVAHHSRKVELYLDKWATAWVDVSRLAEQGGGE